jgi:aspartate-semialdehyde dehydrogenase
MMNKRIPVAVIAATGAVGQRFIQLLDGHPWFEVVALTGSDRRVGQGFAETCHWILPEPMPTWAQELKVQPSDPQTLSVPLVFSALPSKYAQKIETDFAKAGSVVCTNAGYFREDPYVPILLPEINANHLQILKAQQAAHGWSGYVVSNPNCTSTGMTISLKALDDVFGVEQVFAVSMQAISGAGYPGVASLDILDNVIPYIGGEEEKVEWEPRKMLGSVGEEGIRLSGINFSVHTNRVAVRDGHTVVLSVKLKTKADPAAAIAALSSYTGPQAAQGLPSSPEPVIQVRMEPDRPQPRLDRLAGRGMTTVVGRVRPDPLFDLKYVVLSHNTIRGAAGGSILNAEVMVREGLIPAS